MLNFLASLLRRSADYIDPPKNPTIEFALNYGLYSTDALNALVDERILEAMG